MPPSRPLHRECPGCDGVGRARPDWDLCLQCDGIGWIWKDGGPSFSCSMRLGDRRAGEVVTLGDGSVRGRIVIREKNEGDVALRLLFDGLFGDEEAESLTFFPRDTGVSSVAETVWSGEDSAGSRSAREDHVDPMQRRSI